MTHEEQATLDLNDAIRDALRVVGKAVRTAINVQAGLTDTGLLANAESAVSAILALEALEDVAKDGAAKCRAGLAEAMSLGMTTVRTAHHTASLRAAQTRVIVTDASLLPPGLMRQPPAVPDLTAIGIMLRAGTAISGAVLGNGGADILQIRTRKDTLGITLTAGAPIQGAVLSDGGTDTLQICARKDTP